MKIRPKNTILFAQEGVKFSQNNLRGANWRQQVFNNYRQHLLDQLAKYGNDKTYGNWLNEMQSRHSKIYNLAGGKDGNWENTAYQNDLVGQYQHDYKGDKRFGTIKLKNEDIYDFNQGISPNFNSRYVISNPPTRISGDNSTKNFNVDNLYSAITDDRRLLGREGDWDENSQEFKDWQSSLNKLGWKMEKDLNDKYYYLKRLDDDKQEDVTGVKMDLKPINPLNIGEYNRQQALKRLEKDLVTSKIIGDGKPEPPVKTSWWDKLSKTLSQYGPDILEAGRLAGNLRNNQLVYEAVKKGIVPNLKDSYHTYAQEKGDEGTKQAYYRRAVQGEAQAAKPIISDMDKQMAYRMEAKRIGDEARAQGDLADNAEIRRTSDISDQHAWTNKARDNEVAGYNSAELNRVKGILANLDAQKLSADWTNWDTYLTGREYRWRDKLNEYRAATRQKNQILYQNAVDNDPELARITKEIQEHHKSNGNVIDDRIKELQKQLRQRQRDLELEWFDPVVLGRDYVELAKNGTTITYKKKKKDDLLYKQVKDTVEHFRKMVKMSDDSRIRSSKKNERLILPPKTRKMQQGGIAPFTFFKPVALGGETSTQVSSTGSSSSNSSSKSGSGKDEKLDFIKKLYQDMIGAGKGIPIDVSLVANNMTKAFEAASLLGDEISTDQLASMYMSAAQQLSQLQYSKQILDNAEKVATANGALDEYAVTSDGKYIVQDAKGGLKKVGLEQIKQGELNPLTNNQLLFLRNNTPQMALRGGDMIMQEVVANGIGMSKINDEILNMISKIGTDEIVKQGYTKKQANDIKQGLEALLNEAPAGDYEYTISTKDQQRQAQLAEEFILRGLQKNQKAVLEINALKSGMTPRQYVKAIIQSRTDSTQEIKFNAVTGKAAKDTNGNSKEGLEINSAVQLLTGMSSPREFTFNIGNGNSFTGLARISSINDVEEKPFGADFTYSKIYESSLRKNLDLDNASFGDVPINKALKDRIIVDNSTIAGVDLPYIVDSNGRIIPNFKLLKQVEEADNEIMREGIDPTTNPQAANAIYAKHNLPIKYGSDNRLTGSYKRFAVIQATAIEDVFLNKDGLASNGTLTLVSDQEEIDKYTEELKKITGKKNIDLDRPGLLTGNKDIYKGSIFIPIIGDLTDAISGSKTGKLTENNYDDYRSKWNTRNYVKPQEENFGT